jgi:hypothetical protein
MGLTEDHPSVVDVQRKLDKAKAELKRATELDEVRTARWRAAGATEQNLKLFLQGGIPGGVAVVAVGDAPISEPDLLRALLLRRLLMERRTISPDRAQPSLTYCVSGRL